MSLKWKVKIPHPQQKNEFQSLWIIMMTSNESSISYSEFESDLTLAYTEKHRN